MSKAKGYLHKKDRPPVHEMNVFATSKKSCVDANNKEETCKRRLVKAISVPTKSFSNAF
jgi:hypothetical protein